jgi:hypothetical protein
MIYFICFLLRLVSINIYSPPYTTFDIIRRNLKTYFPRSGLKIFSRAGPFLIGFLFGIYYNQYKKKNKHSIFNIFKKYDILIFIISIIFLLFNFLVFPFLKFLNGDNYLVIIFIYLCKVFTHDIFVIGVLGILIYFFLNIDKYNKIFRLFNNSICLFLKKLSLTSYLVMSIIARIYFYSLDEPLTFNFKKISTYILIGLGINLIISLILNVCFIIPFQRVNWIIKSTYINIMEEEGQ